VSDLWSIAVDAPLREPLTYESSLQEPRLERGFRVNVPLGKRQVKGIVLGPNLQLNDNIEKFKIKSVSSIDQEYPQLSEPYIQWMQWISQYYIYPIGLVFESAFPPLSKQTKEKKSSRAPVVPQLERDSPPELTPNQKKVFENISESEKFSTHLLFGVTGSGKTEVYLRLLQRVLDEGKQGLVLVPEISLTPQLIQRFARRFGDKIAVLHSQLTARERTNQWWDIVEGRKKILIGARSAIFCPMKDLNLIIVDEEHEPSFKQDEKLRYHARDSAIMLAKNIDCPIVLGSATPSLETWKNALDGKYHLHRMATRVEDRSLPEVHILNLRELKGQPKTEIPTWLHPRLFEAIGETLSKDEQVALFLNRRGVAPMMVCPACGFVNECPNCDISLTLHGRNHLVCHYCDYHESAKEICPDCKEGEMTAFGVGTEQVEADMQRLFPGTKIARADRDEIQNRSDLESLIEEMENGETNILVGTQMIAKGLDFPKLTLVGLVLADIGFNLPDFRATERSFQLLTQMSGRAGRHIDKGKKPGQVYIQTLNPEHPCLSYSQQSNFEGFADMELEARQMLHYPPLGRLASFRIQGTQLGRVQEASRALAKRAEQLKSINKSYDVIEVLGPAEAALAKLRGQYRYHLLVKSRSNKSLNPFCTQLLGAEDWAPSGVRVSVDIDPLHLL
jgi:primosomal protein N' (replication factor Y)